MELIGYVILVFLGIIMVLLGIIIKIATNFLLLLRSQVDSGFMKKFDIVFGNITGKNTKYDVTVDEKGRVKKEIIDRSY